MNFLKLLIRDSKFQNLTRNIRSYTLRYNGKYLVNIDDESQNKLVTQKYFSIRGVYSVI